MYQPHTNGYDQNFPSQENKRFTNIGWGVSRGTLPMHSPVWTNSHKSWLRDIFSVVQKFTQNFSQTSQKRSSKSILAGSKLMTTPANAASSNIVFIFLCGLWYTTSALSSNTGKAILTNFRYPVTLTFIQFGFVALYCLLFMTPLIRFSKLRAPSRVIIQSTLPMGMFQVGGHMFSSIAISRIPVSTVHTIKALSPLFTVAAYALLFGVKYSRKTYLSLLPLTVGVMLTCSFDMSASNAVGIICAFGSALVFVSSNIFFKKIMPSNTGGSSLHTSHKLDKLNLLLYSSSMAFLLMIPLWIYYDLPVLLTSWSNPTYVSHPTQGHSAPHSIFYYFFMNGTVHFAQNIIAFVVLSSTSPVTYSIASLIKRVVVICIAIVWFSQTVHPIQALGIAMTFTGLYLYNQAKVDVERGEKKMRRVEVAREMMLPTTKGDTRLMSGEDSPPRQSISPEFESAEATGAGLVFARPRGATISSSSHSLHNHRNQHHHQRPSVVLSNTSIKQIPAPLDIHHSPLKIATARDSSSPYSYPSPPSSNSDSPPSVTKLLPDTNQAIPGLGMNLNHYTHPVVA